MRSDDHPAIFAWVKKVVLRHGLSVGLALYLVLTAMGIYVLMSTILLDGARATPRSLTAPLQQNYQQVPSGDLKPTGADTVQDRGPPLLPCGCF